MLVRLCVADFCFLVVSYARSVAQAATVRRAVCPCVVTVTCSAVGGVSVPHTRWQVGVRTVSVNLALFSRLRAEEARA